MHKNMRVESQEVTANAFYATEGREFRRLVVALEAFLTRTAGTLTRCQNAVVCLPVNSTMLAVELASSLVFH